MLTLICTKWHNIKCYACHISIGFLTMWGADRHNPFHLIKILSSKFAYPNNSRYLVLISSFLSHVASSTTKFLHKTFPSGIFLFLNSCSFLSSICIGLLLDLVSCLTVYYSTHETDQKHTSSIRKHGKHYPR